MKKLICASDVEEIIGRDECVIYTDKETILTPFAMDIIKNNNLKIIKKDIPEKIEDINLENLDLNSLTEFLRIIAKDDLLQLLIQKLLHRDKKYEKEVDENGFTLIRGRSMTFEDIGGKIKKQEVVKDDEKSISLLKVQRCRILREIGCEEVAYVLGGSLKVRGRDRWYQAETGDILTFPQGGSMEVDVSQDLQLLCFSKESNWISDLLDIKGGC